MATEKIVRPTAIGEYLEQLRDPIPRSEGTTPSERFLARLADKTFLNLWSYPNPFRDQRVSGGADGKELCDLLVVCDPYVLIFSEKQIAWPDRPIDVAWPRWYRKAIDASVSQLRGAERWISEYPDRIFLDRQCTIRFPLAFPALAARRVHRVVVAHGAAEACRTYFKGGTGSFVIKPEIQGADHCDPASPRYSPFHVGDVDPASDFVHVLDEASLGTVLSELDTISDLTRYLDRRAAFLRSGHLDSVHGEEDLLAYYASRFNEDGEHDFCPPGGGAWAPGTTVSIDGSHFPGLTAEPRYMAKKEADRISYAWDTLIETFTGHMLGGTSIVLPGFEYSLTQSEIGLRYMAQQSRVERRGLGEALISALKEGERRQVFFRAVLSSESAPTGTGFFFLTVKYLDWMDQKGGYEQYRLFRSGYAQVYAQALLMKHPSLLRVVGIAMEPPNQGRGSSEDCVYVEQTDWPESEVTRVEEACEELGIMRSLRPRSFRLEEYPEPLKSPGRPHRSGPASGMNRRERRALAAKLRKGGKP